MKEDLTHYFLVNPLWLLGGLVLYFFITLFKVHLIWYIQPKIFNDTNESLFKDYFKNFFQILTTKKRIIRPAFRYIFRYNKKDFLVLDSDATKPVKKRLAILEGLTTFLKPYLIFALLWILIEFWISRKLLFNETKITLGQVQELLNFIEKIPFIAFLQKHKLAVLLVYGTFCALIPFLYDKEETTKKYKKYFTESLVYLSLIANISFFGALTGKTTSGKSENLADLNTKVVAIHDNIYKEIAIAIVYNDIEDSLRHDNDLYNEEAKRFSSLSDSTKEIKVDHEIKEDLIKELGKHLFNFKRTSLVESSEPAGDDFRYNKNSHRSTSKTFNDYYEINLKNSNQYSNYTSYMGNQAAWNKAEGERILKDVKGIAKQNLPATSLFDKKLEKILGHFFDYGIESSLTELLYDLGINTHKTLKKVATLLLTENYKKSLIERTIRILNSFKSDIKKTENIFSESPVEIESITEADIKQSKMENNVFFERQKLIAENRQLQNDIINKVDALEITIPDNAEILNRVSLSAFNDNITVRNEYEAKSYLTRKGCVLNNEKSLRDNLIDKEKNGLTKNFFDAYSDTENLKGYNEYLKKSLSNLSSQKTANVSLNEAIINIAKSVLCPFCGLPIKGPSPFCPTNFIKRL